LARDGKTGANGASFGDIYGPTILSAFDATNLGTRLFPGEASSAHTAGNAATFTAPTVVFGEDYVADRRRAKATSGQLTVCGPRP